MTDSNIVSTIVHVVVTMSILTLAVASVLTEVSVGFVIFGMVMALVWAAINTIFLGRWSK